MDLEPRLRGNEQYQNLIESQSTRDQSISPPSQIGSHFEKRIQQAIDIKNDGNTEFKAQRFDEARNVYQKALGLLEPSTFYGATEAECVKMAELSANLLFNIGSCFFNQHKWKEAEMIYNEAITVNPYYIKALYKRAVARYELSQFEGAMADIKQAFNLDKSNKEIYETYEKIIVKYNESVKKQREKSKELSEKIFNTSKTKLKEAEIEAEKQKEKDEGGNKWWILPLVSLVGVGLYQGLKLLRK